MRPVRVLGFDPGLAHLGWGVITLTSNGDEILYEAHGTFKTLSEYSSSVRVGMIYKYIHDKIIYYGPDVVMAEDVFGHGSHYNGKDAAKVIGLIELACDETGVPCHVWGPGEIKKRVTGRGNATKNDITFAIKKLLPGAPIDGKASCEHENDALAIALAFALPAPLPVKKVKNKLTKSTKKKK